MPALARRPSVRNPRSSNAARWPLSIVLHLLGKVKEQSGQEAFLRRWLSAGEIVLLTGRSCLRRPRRPELGLIFQTGHVARGSVDCSCFRYCSLHHCSLFKEKASRRLSLEQSCSGTLGKRLQMFHPPIHKRLDLLDSRQLQQLIHRLAGLFVPDVSNSLL